MKPAFRNHLVRRPLAWAVLLGSLPVLADEFDVPSEDFPTMQAAVDAAAAAGNGSHVIHLREARIDLFAAISIGADFDEDKPLTIRPDPSIVVLRRVTLAAHFGHEPIVAMTGAGHVTLQDLDLIRHTTNQEDLLRLRSCERVVLERCRVGSDWTTTGVREKCNLVIADPRRVIVRNCVFFAREPATFERGISVSMGTAQGHSILLYNNVVADHRTYGLEIGAQGDSVVLLRNNVVANHAALDAEPTAFHSALDGLTRVISSHNTAFASEDHFEQQDGPQGIAGAEGRLRFERGDLAGAFVETQWRIEPAWHPNPNGFRLRRDGLLHHNAADAGITVVADALPDPFDAPVTDDLEQDVRPSGQPPRTDRGADQSRELSAGDLRVTLPHIPPVNGLSLGGSYVVRSGPILVGPQEDLPGVPFAMHGHGFRLLGRCSSIEGPLPHSAQPQPPALAIETGAAGLTVVLTWPAAAADAVLEARSELGSTASWKAVDAPHEVVGAWTRVTVPMSRPQQFFRLRP